MFILLFSFYLIQDIPPWLDAQLTEENRELILLDIDELEDRKIDFDQITLNQLRTELYFIPDAILTLYRKKSHLLSFSDRQFINQFNSEYNRFKSKHYSLFRSTLNSDPESDSYLGNQSIFKSYHQMNIQSVRLNYTQVKLKHEQFASHHFFYGHFKFKWFDLIAGQFSLKGLNPLIFSRPFGKRFVANQRLNRPALISANPQQSINKQNHLNGLMISHQFGAGIFGLIYGQQEHHVSYKTDHFESFNFYFPTDKQSSIDSKQTVTETDLIAFLQFPLLSNYFIDINYFALNLSEQFVRTSDYQAMQIQTESYFSIIHRFDFEQFQFSLNHSSQINKQHSVEIAFSSQVESSRFDAAYFYSDYNYLNPHSTGFMDGADFATNRFGYFIQFANKFHSNLSAYLALLESTELRSRDFDVFPKQSTKIESGLDVNLNPHQFHFIYSESGDSRKIKFLHRFKLATGKYLFQQHYFYSDGSYYNQFRYNLGSSRIGFGYAESTSGITVYEYGLNREFLTDYIRDKLVYLFTKFRFDISDQFQLSAVLNLKKGLELNRDLKSDFAFALGYSF